MIEPDILSVAELAARWKQTPLQIINHALSLKVPLYFQFEGLAFEQDDDSSQQEQIGINRNRRQYRGYLRTPPATLWSLASTGTALLPNKAFHPLSRISIGTQSDRPGQVWEGHLLRLQPGMGCKNNLTIEDLSIPMLEVKAIEAFQKSKQPDTAPEQTHPAPTVEAVTPAPVALVEPATPTPVTASIAVPKQRAQENRILELLATNHYNPVKLPKRVPGKPGTKAEIRTLAMTEPNLFTKKTFEQAWERLRGDGSIDDAE